MDFRKSIKSKKFFIWGIPSKECLFVFAEKIFIFNRKGMGNMTEATFNRLIEILDREIKWAFEARAHAESQSTVNYWSGYYSGLQRALELLLKARHLWILNKNKEDVSQCQEK